MCQKRSQPHGSDLPVSGLGGAGGGAGLCLEAAKPWGHLMGPPLELLKEQSRRT